MEVSVQYHAPASLPPKLLARERTPIPIDSKLGESGRFGEEKKKTCCSPFDTHTRAHAHTHIASFEIRTVQIFILLCSEIKIFYFTA